MPLVRVLVCSNYPLVSTALALEFEQRKRITDVAISSNVVESAEFILSQRPAVVVNTYAVRDGGICLAKWAHEVAPNSNIVYVNDRINDVERHLLYRSGVKSILGFTSTASEIAGTAERLMSCDHDQRSNSMPPNKAARCAVPEGANAYEYLLRLSPVDKEIVASIWEGLSDSEIANRVFLSVQTIRNRVSQILHDCGRTNRTQLARLYLDMRDVMDSSRACAETLFEITGGGRGSRAGESL